MGLIVRLHSLRIVLGKSVAPLSGIVLAIIWWVTAQNGPYAVLDDYRMVSAVKSMRPFIVEGHAETEFLTGRIVPAVLFDLVWVSVQSIDNLWYVRLLGLFVVAGSIMLYQVWFIQYAAISSPLAKLSVAITSFSILLLPSVAATTTWAQKTTQLLALPLALLAGILTTSHNLRRRRWWIIAALVFLSVFCYQHFAATAVLPLAIALGIEKSTFLKPPIWRIFMLLFLIISALSANLLFVRLIAPYVLERVSERSMLTRFSETIDVLAKGVHIFIDKDVLLVFLSGLLVSVLVTIALLIDRRSVFVGVAAVIAVGSSVAITLGGDGDSSYRMTMPTQISLWLGLASLISFSLQHCRTRVGMSFKLIALAALLVVSLIIGIENRDVVQRKISLANAKDWSELNCHLDSLGQGGSLKEVVVRLSPTPLSGSGAVASEIGLLARHVGWVFRDQWELAITSNSDLAWLNQVNLRVLDYDQSLPPKTSSRKIIDLRASCNAID